MTHAEPNNTPVLPLWHTESPQEEMNTGPPDRSHQVRRHTLAVNSTIIQAEKVVYENTPQPRPIKERNSTSEEERLRRPFSGCVIRSAIPITRKGDKELKYVPGTFDKLVATVGKHITHSASSCRLLLLHGPVGSGKSALLKEVYVRHHKSLVAFFFHPENKRHNCTHVMPTIVYQLSKLIPEVKVHLSAVMDSDLKAASMCKQFQGFILDAFRANPQLRDSFVIVFDGIDICPPEDQEDLFRLVKEGVGNGFRFILSCRKRLRDIPILSADRVKEVVIDRESGRAAVRRYLTVELERVWEAKANIVDECPCPDATAVDELAEEADGQMLFAKSITTYVDTAGTSPQQRLEDARKGHVGALYDVDERYRGILTRYEQRSGGIQACRKVLSIVVALFQPQQIPVIARLAGLKDDDVNLVVVSLPGLLVKDGDTFCVFLAYKSLRKFLTDKSRSNDFWIDERKAHQFIIDNTSKFFPSSTLINETPARRPALTAFDIGQRYLSEWFFVHCAALKTAKCNSDTRMLIDLMVALGTPQPPEILADVLGIPIEEPNKFLPRLNYASPPDGPRIFFPVQELFPSLFNSNNQPITALLRRRWRRLITLAFRVLSNACRCSTCIFNEAPHNSQPSVSAVEFVLRDVATELALSPKTTTQRLCVDVDELQQHGSSLSVPSSPCRLYFLLEALCGKLLSYIPTDQLGDLRRIVGVVATSHRPLSQASLAQILNVKLEFLQKELLRYPDLFGAPLPDASSLVQISLESLDDFLDNTGKKYPLNPPFTLAEYHHFHLAAIDSGRAPAIGNLGDVVRRHYNFCTSIIQQTFREGIRASLKEDATPHTTVDGRRYRFLAAILGLENLPVDFRDAVSASLDSIARRVIAGSSMPSPAKVLGVLLVFTHPLSVGDLRGAADMSFPLREFSASLDALKPILEVSGDPESPRFGISDVTRGFLLDVGRAGDYLVDQQACHDTIALQDLNFRSLLIRSSFGDDDGWPQPAGAASFDSVPRLLTDLEQRAQTRYTDGALLDQFELGVLSSLVNCDTHYRACSKKTLDRIASLVEGVGRGVLQHYIQRRVSPLSFQLLLNYYVFLSTPLQPSSEFGTSLLKKSVEGLAAVLERIAPSGQSVIAEKDRKRLLVAMYRAPGLDPRTSSLLDSVIRLEWKGQIMRELANDARDVICKS